METECAGVFGGRWGSSVSVAQSVAFRLLDAVVGLCYGSFLAKGRIQTQQETPPQKKENEVWDSWLGVWRRDPKANPKSSTYPCCRESQNPLGVALWVPSALVPSYQQGVPVCSLPALGQAARPGQLVPRGPFQVCHSHPWFGCWACRSPGWAGRGLPAPAHLRRAL